MNLLIGIPAYNEASVIGKVLKSIPGQIKGIKSIDILVVDDGSSDDTSMIAEKAGARVISHLLNRGLGGALKTILAYTRGQDYDILVTFDADGQHDGGDIPALVRPLLLKKKDVVIGSRWHKGQKKPTSRLLINKLANLLTFLLYGVKTTDSQSGLRAFGKRAINSISIQTDGMEVSSEIFKEINRHNLQFVEVPIKVIYTDYSKTKGQKLTNAGSIFLQLFLRLLR